MTQMYAFFVGVFVSSLCMCANVRVIVVDKHHSGLLDALNTAKPGIANAVFIRVR